MAVPFLVTGSRLVGLAGAMRARRAVHALERVLGRSAEHLAGIRLDVVGLEKVDPSQRYVVVALHEGFADALALLRLPLRLRFAARDELFEWPTLGRYLEAARHVRVDTLPSLASARRFFREAGEALDAGDSLVVFAQGTILGVEIAFRDSPLRLARRFGCPLLPVVLTGSHRVWEHPYSPALRFGQEISVRVLDPLPADQLEPASFRELERNMKRMALSEEVASARRFRPERDGWWDGYPYEIDPDFPALQERVAAHRRPIRSDSGHPPPGGRNANL